MNLFHTKSLLSSPWRERFADVATLNEYAKSHSVDIADSVIENKNIDGVKIRSGKMENTEWKNVKAKYAHFSNVMFHEGTIEDVDFSHSVLTNVVFENMRLVEAKFFHATLKNVHFVHCTFNGSNIDQTLESDIEVVDSKVINTSLSEGQLVAVFKNSQLYKGTSLTDLERPSSLTFHNSDLHEVDLDRSSLESLKFDGGSIQASSFKSANADSISLDKSVADISFSESTIQHLIVKESKLDRLMLNFTTIKDAVVHDCESIRLLAMSEANVGNFEVTDTTLQDFAPLKSHIDSLNIKDSQIKKAAFYKMHAKNVNLDNVTLSGTIDFTGAHIFSLKTKNITKQQGLKLITEGSNVML